MKHANVQLQLCEFCAFHSNNALKAFSNVGSCRKNKVNWTTKTRS